MTDDAIQKGREKIAKLAEADGEIKFAREVRAGCWDHRLDVTRAILFEKSFERPRNYFDLSEEAQWEIDKGLGLLDWDGTFERLNKDDQQRFKAHFGGTS